jgi:hypothetical protein
MTNLIGLNEYIADIAQNKLINYVQYKYTEEEETIYYASDDYEIHLTYLIETWKSYIECNFYYNIDYDEKFECMSKYFEAGRYTPEFNDEWLDDIFEGYILFKTVCLK